MIKKGLAMKPNAKTTSTYKSELTALVKRMTKAVFNSIVKLFTSRTGEDYRESQEKLLTIDESISAQSNILINSLKSRFTQLFKEKAKPVSEKMVKSNLRTSKQKVNTTLKQLSKEVEIDAGLISKALPKTTQEIAKANIIESVNLIKSIPEQHMKNISTKVVQNILAGGNIGQLKKDLMSTGAVTERRAELIAADQVRKSYNSVAVERMKSIGFKKFMWNHSGGGQHPRKSHQEMDGKIFSFDDLPVVNQEQVDKGYEGPRKGIPGQEPNCKCFSTPVIEYDDDEE